MPTPKPEIRARLKRQRATRGGRSGSERAALVESWREVLTLLGCDASSVRLPALFVPTRDEPDITGIIALYQRCLLPLLCDEDGTVLPSPQWGEFRLDGSGSDAGDSSRKSAYSPPPNKGRFITYRRSLPAQPDVPQLGPDALLTADVALIAAIGVDRGGARVGHGAGWYDRALTALRPGAPVIAAVFDDEIMPAGTIPVEGHDHLIQGVITPTQAFVIG